VLLWLVEATEQLQAFSRHVLHDVSVWQAQLDELFALFSVVKDNEVMAADAIERLERSSQWVWVATDPESMLLLTIEVSDRTLALTPHLQHDRFFIDETAADCSATVIERVMEQDIIQVHYEQ
jgi:hypothetical protein